MRIIDLTLPLQNGMNYYCTGILPWEVPFKAWRTVPGDLELGGMSMYCEVGTRYICLLPKKIGTLLKDEIGKLVMKDAVMLHVPKEAKEGGNPITKEDIEAGIKRCPARKGDAILLHTGHGDNEKYYKLGEKWELWAPYISPKAIPPLVDFLKKLECPLFGYDSGNISWQATDRVSIHNEWTMRKPRPEPNSPEAIYIGWNYWLTGKFNEEFKELYELLRLTDMLGCLINCGDIKAERFKLMIAPLKVIDWGIVPATIYAIEE